MLDHVERVGVKPRGERIVDHEVGNGEQSGVAGILNSILLQSAQIVGVAELRPQLLEDVPIALLPLWSDLLLQVPLKVGGDAVVVEERVVHVEQEDQAVVGRHECAPAHGRLYRRCGRLANKAGPRGTARQAAIKVKTTTEA